MCLIREAINLAISRRAFLKGAGSLAAVPLVAGLGANVLSTPSPITSHSKATQFHTRLALLGTAGGPLWYPDCDRVSASSALVVGDSIYLIDLGHGSAQRLAQVFNRGNFVNGVQVGNPTYLHNVEALFFTHLHMDHTADYPTLLTVGYGAGMRPDKPLKVIGPGNRGQVEADIYGLNVPLVNEENPSPGTVEMTRYLWQAFAQTINDFTRDIGYPDFTSLVEVSDIRLPRLKDFIDPNTTPCVGMKPFTIYLDHNVRVQATLVDHHQVFPSFAFRFDTQDGSIVFSGDTGPDTKGNLQKLAKGADILVHEVIDPAWITANFPDQSDPSVKATVTHLEAAHTTIEALGAVAKEAEVKTLVLSHIVPGNAPISHLKEVNFSGELIIGEDKMQIGVGKPTTS